MTNPSLVAFTRIAASHCGSGGRTIESGSDVRTQRIQFVESRTRTDQAASNRETWAGAHGHRSNSTSLQSKSGFLC
jgi:hypothetical protein